MRKHVTSILPHEILDSRSLNGTKRIYFLILNQLQKYGKELLYPTR